MIQDGKLRGFAMGHAIPVRTDYAAGEVRRFAQRAKDAAQARRLLAIAAVLDGASREEAAKIGGMDRQTLRDWVIRFNEQGADGLIFLARIVEAIAKKQAIIQQPQLAQSARVSTEQSSNAARQALIFRMFHLRRFMNVIVGLFRIEERGMTTRWTYIAFTALGLHSNAALAVEAAAKRPTIPPPSFLFMDANSDYRQKLREYLEAREKYESEAKA